MKVKETFTWHRVWSMGAPVEVHSGAPVVKGDNDWNVYLVHPKYFPVESKERDEAILFGCYVNPENIEE